MMPKSFTCYHTFYKEASTIVPVTVGYDCSISISPLLASHPASQFIHSGNWWTIKPGKRARDVVLDRQISLVNKNTAGLMSMNVQPGNDPNYWINKEQDENNLHACLDNANYARDEARSRGIQIPIYCTLQPATGPAAETWFQKAIDAGHTHLCMGVSEYLKSPRYRAEGTKRILSITRTVQRILGKKKGYFHLSGLTSYSLLPIVAALGATSTDGSTPVQSALAYGTVFIPGSGKGMQANVLWNNREKTSWDCPCEACKGKTKEQIFQDFKDPRERVNHNLITWKMLVDSINDEILRDPIAWQAQNANWLPPASKKSWALAMDLLEKKEN
jgi:hypothetical protein